jgi:DNA-binding YbaB/EbfC family protein
LIIGVKGEIKMFDKMHDLMKLQKQAKEIKDSLKSIVIECEKAGGRIKLTMDGEQKIKSLSIDEKLLKDETKVFIENNLRDCFNEAVSKTQRAIFDKTRSSIDLGSLMK